MTDKPDVAARQAGDATGGKRAGQETSSADARPQREENFPPRKRGSTQGDKPAPAPVSGGARARTRGVGLPPPKPRPAGPKLKSPPPPPPRPRPGAKAEEKRPAAPPPPVTPHVRRSGREVKPVVRYGQEQNLHFNPNVTTFLYNRDRPIRPDLQPPAKRSKATPTPARTPRSTRNSSARPVLRKNKTPKNRYRLVFDEDDEE